MRILTLSNYFPEHIGGIEFAALNLVTRWRKRHQVRWMASDVKKHAHVPGADDVPLTALNFTEEHFGFPYPIPTGRAISVIRREVRQCDIVHLNDCLYMANWIVFFAARLFRKPLIITQHAALASYPEAYKRVLQWLAYRAMGRLLLANAEQVVFISARVKKWFESWMHFRKEALFIPNGIDHGIFFPPEKGEREEQRAQLGFLRDDAVFLFIGRFMQNKGVPIIRKLAESLPSTRWVMIGAGEINPRQWRLPNVQVIPSQAQATLRTYCISADLFVLPSVGEGFPLSVQEAMACGLPVAVSTEIADYLPDAPVIRLEVENLSQMLQTLHESLGDKSHLPALRLVTAEYARQWEWDHVAEKYQELFTQQLQQAPGTTTEGAK